MEINEILDQLLDQVDRFDAELDYPVYSDGSPSIRFYLDTAFGEYIRYNQLVDIVDRLQKQHQGI